MVCYQEVHQYARRQPPASGQEANFDKEHEPGLAHNRFQIFNSTSPALATPRRGFALCREAVVVWYFHEPSVYWTRVHNLFDGPRMRHQCTRIYEQDACGVHKRNANSKRHVKLVALVILATRGP